MIIQIDIQDKEDMTVVRTSTDQPTTTIAFHDQLGVIVVLTQEMAVHLRELLQLAEQGEAKPDETLREDQGVNGGDS